MLFQVRYSSNPITAKIFFSIFRSFQDMVEKGKMEAVRVLSIATVVACHIQKKKKKAKPESCNPACLLDFLTMPCMLK